MKTFAKILPLEKYTLYLYKGLKSKIFLSATRREYKLSKGNYFAIRPSSANDKLFRVIFPELGDTIIFSLDKNIIENLLSKSSKSRKNINEIFESSKKIKLYSKILINPVLQNYSKLLDLKVKDLVAYKTCVVKSIDIDAIKEAIAKYKGKNTVEIYVYIYSNKTLLRFSSNLSQLKIQPLQAKKILQEYKKLLLI